MAEIPERNLGLDLVRVTETAAMAAARWVGRGDKEGVDRAAVDAMRAHLSTLDLDGVVVIGEGEKDNAPDALQRGAGRSADRPRGGRRRRPGRRHPSHRRGRPRGAGGARRFGAGDDVRPRQAGVHGQDRGRRRGCGDHRPRCPRRVQPAPGGQGAG